MQHTIINLVTSWAPSNSWNFLHSNHIVALDLFCCHYRRHTYLTGITFLKLCPFIHSSLNEADDCGSRAMAGKNINKT